MERDDVTFNEDKSQHTLVEEGHDVARVAVILKH